ncbi:MAG: MFS transporter [Dehalococcoidia bacterium]|nr:MFS transporter [Dehalococcoidia bacterium]
MVKPIFYGWWIVFAALAINILNGGTAIYGLTLFIRPVIDDFGWSYLEVSSAIALTSVLIGVLSPVIGGLVDRFGSRKVVIISSLVVGVSFVILGFTNSILVFYLAFAIMAAGAGGIGTISLQAVIGNWFRRRMGLAMGIVSTGVGLGGLLLPVIAWLILTWDWRTASFVIGIGICVVMPSLATVLRQRPEDCGLYPDGDRSSLQPHTAAAGRGMKRPTDGVSAGKALRTNTFWLLTIAYSIYFMGLNAVILHIAPFLQSVNLEPSTAAVLATVLAVISNVGRVGYGFLGDLIPRKYAFAGTLLSQSLGLVVVLFAPSSWALGLFIFLYGTGYGGSVALSSAMTREYFGGVAFGAIQGWFFAGTTLAGIIGPIFAGWVFDTYQSYNVAWLVFAVANACGIASVIVLKRRPATGHGSAT